MSGIPESVKLWIVYSRIQDKKSYQQISLELRSKYGISRTKQGIQQLCHKELNGKHSIIYKFSEEVVLDIVNLYARGHNGFRIQLILSDSQGSEQDSQSSSISYANILAIVSNKRLLAEIQDSLLSKVRMYCSTESSLSIHGLQRLLEYHGYLATEQSCVEFLKIIHKDNLVSNIRDSLSGLAKVDGIQRSDIDDVIIRAYNDIDSKRLLKDAKSRERL